MGKRFDYKGQSFVIDGKEVCLYSGAIHYFRNHPSTWYDRLLKLKECGFNCVETYMCWNLHEPQEGKFDFSGMLDVVKFIEIAEELGLYVIVRPGPYICAEWEMGGLPAWLLKNKGIYLRSSDPVYLEKLKNYLDKILPMLKPHTIEEGGKILMIQLENEYGSYGCDRVYLDEVYRTFQKHLPNCKVFTADGTDILRLEGGYYPGLLCCGNFGSHVKENMDILEKFAPNQPQMCMEFWAGWFDQWGLEHVTRAPEDVVKELQHFIDRKQSFNVYMFCGGTNFGFTNGTNVTADGYFHTVTSYDYYAPLSEAGDRTPAYYAIRDMFIKNGVEVPELTAKESEKTAYGEVKFTESADLFENLDNIGKYTFSQVPQKMEDLDQNFGYILYHKKIDRTFPNFSMTAVDLQDRANVYLDDKLVAIWDRNNKRNSVKIDSRPNKPVDFKALVENQGRVNFREFSCERKGVAEFIVDDAQRFFGWDHYTLPMDNLEKLTFKNGANVSEKPTFYKAEFNIEKCTDTFIKPEGFSKGFIVINGFNLGRYNNMLGPQKTLYVPAAVLKEGKNEIVIFDSEGAKEIKATFVAEPILDDNVELINDKERSVYM